MYPTTTKDVAVLNCKSATSLMPSATYLKLTCNTPIIGVQKGCEFSLEFYAGIRYDSRCPQKERFLDMQKDIGFAIADNEKAVKQAFERGDFLQAFLLVHVLVEALLRTFLGKHDEHMRFV